jgi:hypothetical protein
MLPGPRASAGLATGRIDSGHLHIPSAVTPSPSRSSLSEQPASLSEGPADSESGRATCRLNLSDKRTGWLGCNNLGTLELPQCLCFRRSTAALVNPISMWTAISLLVEA